MVDKNRREAALALVLGTGASAFGLLILSSPFLIVPAITRLGRIPWMTTPLPLIQKALAQLPPPSVGTGGSRPRLIDLGSGDGRVVIEAARRGYSGVGLELNPVLIALSYFNAAKAGVLLDVTFRMKDFWSEDLRPYAVVTCFGVAPVMARLDEKLCVEAHSGARVICFRFPIKQREPNWRDGELYMYKI